MIIFHNILQVNTLRSFGCPCAKQEKMLGYRSPEAFGIVAFHVKQL